MSIFKIYLLHSSCPLELYRTLSLKNLDVRVHVPPNTNYSTHATMAQMCQNARESSWLMILMCFTEAIPLCDIISIYIFTSYTTIVELTNLSATN